jgi:hypothetical protein
MRAQLIRRRNADRLLRKLYRLVAVGSGFLSWTLLDP